MPKSMTGLMILLTSSLLVFSLGAQERDDSRLRPAERNRTGTLRQLIPGYYVFSSTSFNSGVIATSEGVVVLDALTSEAIARQEARNHRECDQATGSFSGVIDFP